MHKGNVEWLMSIQERYGEFLANSRLLEIGSLNVNGTSRTYLKTKQHIGIDVLAGNCVDVQCDAEQTQFDPNEFDVLLSISMMEHNPRWREGLTHNLQWLRPHGLIVLSWGAEGNTKHWPEPWAAVPVGDVLEYAMNQRLTILEAFWEGSRFSPDCKGCYDMLLCKAPSLALIR